MNSIVFSLAFCIAALSPVVVPVEESTVVRTEVPAKKTAEKKASEEVRSTQMESVTSTYGVNAETYQLQKEDIESVLWPNIRSSAGSISFDMPDAFYFIAVPVFFMLFIRIFTNLLDDIEEKRIQELRDEYHETHSMY